MRKFALSLLASFACYGSSQAAVLLTIDISNPAAVVITATGANADAFAFATGGDGITLTGLFTAPVVFGMSGITTGSTLQPSGQGLPFNTFMENDYGFSGSTVDLNLFTLNMGGSPAGPTFFTDAAAFTGSATLDLSAASFAALGATGQIMAARNFGTTSIGQWLVVPEPSTLLLGVFGGAGLLRRRR